MNTNAKPIARAVLLSQLVALPALVLAGCGEPIVFHGKAPISVVGTPPPPPPPPPPPKKVEPPPPPARVELRDNKIEIREKIQFKVNSAEILDVSFDLLNEIAKVMNDNPQVKKIRIEGHASAEGNAARNKKLSAARAKSVLEYLVTKGNVDKNRLVSEGYGSERPIADNETEEGREKNRRVEFNVIEQEVTAKKVEIDPKTGKEKVIESSTQTVSKEPAAAEAKPAEAKPAEAKPATTTPAAAPAAGKAK